MLRKIKVILAVSIFVFNGSYSFSQEINSEKVNYNLAINNIQKGNYQEATNYLLKVLKLNSTNAQAHYNLGVCYKKLGFIDKAFVEFNKSFEIIDTANNVNKPIELESKPIVFKHKVESVAKSISPDITPKNIINSAQLTKEPEMSIQESDYIQMAEVYSESNEFDKAIEYLKLIVELNPSNSKAYYLLAKSYYTTENIEKAEENINKALNIIPNSKDFLEFQQKINNKDVNKTIALDEKRTVSFVDNQNISLDADYYNKKGVEYIKYQDYEKAESYFYKSIELNKSSYQAYNNLAFLSLNSGNYDNAIKYANKALSFNPELSEALYNIAFAYKKKNNNSKALEYLNKTIILNPQNEKAYYLKALIYLDLKETKKAKENLLKTIKIKDNHYDANFNVAILFANEGNALDAISYMVNASKDKNDNGKIAYYLGMLYESINDKDLANNAFQESINKNYKDANLFIHYANSVIETKNYEKALNIIDTGLKLNPSSHELYNLKGMILLNTKKISDAKDAFAKAIDLNEKRPIYHYNLSQCYLLLEKRDLSSSEFQKAIEIKPIYPQEYIDLTSILIDRGMNDNATLIAKEGLKNYPDENRLNLILAELLEDKALLKESKTTLKKYNKNNVARPIKKQLDEKLQYLNRF